MIGTFEAQDPADAFHDRSAQDGVWPYAFENGESFCAGIERHVNGNCSDSIELRSVPQTDERNCGDADREMLLAAAICRFISTGGAWETVEKTIERIRRVCPEPPTFPEYYYLEHMLVEDEGSYQHVFAHEDGVNAILWQEADLNGIGGFIEAQTRANLNAQE